MKRLLRRGKLLILTRALASGGLAVIVAVAPVAMPRPTRQLPCPPIPSRVRRTSRPIHAKQATRASARAPASRRGQAGNQLPRCLRNRDNGPAAASGAQPLAGHDRRAAADPETVSCEET